ncbi:MAG: Ribosomal-protein-S18p-alanine acetyltransferase [Myxococcaceae bacterium]|nr:Ribosomal-protein-S18p-alanine acetyltransferase [Myxococcaceae bacterium]
MPSRTSTRIAIEPMRESDLPAVATIGALAFHTSGKPSPGAAAEESQLREEMARPWAKLFVARAPSASEPIAFVITWFVADEVHVLNVATHPDWRRQGVAEKLMAEVIELARTKDVRHLLLEVRRSNANALALYRKLGFYAMGLRKNYYPDQEDAVEMVLLFDAVTKEILQKPDEVRLEGTS